MEIIIKVFEDDGSIPNSRLPVIIYRKFAVGDDALRPEYYDGLLEKNGWGGGWRNGLFSYHHYHSTAHEILCIYSGWVEAQIGGEKGDVFRMEAGDAVLLPAGIGHKNLQQGGGFSVVGSYPEGQHPDMNYGRDGERPAADRRISDVAMPGADPLLGHSGGLNEYW